MTISCEEVIREVSNYVEGDVDVQLRAEIAAHLAECDHCKAVYDGTRNVLTLVCDDRTFSLPAGFGQRLYAKLKESAKA